MFKLTRLFLFLYLYLARVAHRAKGVFSLCIARKEREKTDRRLRTSQVLNPYYLVKCLVPKTAESVCVMWRPWRGHFRYTI